MASRFRPVLAPLGLVLCGAVGTEAWHHGLWGLLTGALLVSIWIGVLLAAWTMMRPPARDAARDEDCRRDVLLRALLDAAPTPLLAIEGDRAHVLNRAARNLFAAEDLVLPAPPELLEDDRHYLRHEGRSWRIDRVKADFDGYHVVAALIDIEQEERAAEARATAELVQLLGHELLNGLAPIVSLAESGLALAGEEGDRDSALLAEILGTLARHAEGLQRFTAGYRALARLPDPLPRPVPLRELADDLARLFAGRWPELPLAIDAPDGLAWPLDRDQISQASWALLQNAAEAVSGCRNGDGRVGLAIRETECGLAIEVADNGDGVPPDLAPTLFRPFRTTKPDGTGIGLSLARHIAFAHGGSLTLEPGAPTTFRMVLPQRETRP